MSKSLRCAGAVVSGYYDDILSPAGIHANQLALLVIPYRQGPISINQMSARTSLDRTTLVRNLKLLEKEGLIAVKPGEDLRTRMVTITPLGKKTLAQAVPLWEKAQKQVIAHLGTHHRAYWEHWV